MRRVFFASAIAVMASAGFAHAGTVFGSIWENNANAGNATPANVPGTTPDVTFLAPDPLNFNYNGDYTIGGYLATGGASVLTGVSELGKTVDNTLWNFTGNVSVTQGETFTVGHDDGLTLIINGVTVVDAPGPAGGVSTPFTWNGADGTYAFQLVYGECCGPGAILDISLPLTSPSATPLPAALPLFAGGLGMVGWLSRRRKQKGVGAVAA